MGGGAVAGDDTAGKDYEAKFTWYVGATTLVAAGAGVRLCFAGLEAELIPAFVCMHSSALD